MSQERPGRYRKLYPRLFRHSGYRKLSPSGRELTFYLLAGPQTNRLGLFYFSVSAAAEDLGVGVETLRKGLADVCQTFAWHYDAEARVFFIPSWWRWNAPENQNVLRGNLKDLNDLPDSGLVEAFARNTETLAETLLETFTKGCMECLGQRSPIQDQEHLQKQEQKPGANAQQLLPLVGTAKSQAGQRADFETIVDTLLEIARSKRPGVNFKRKDAIEALSAA